ncbi:AraC family transcriptional regulator [Paenibacillus sp.]|uniref:AraC family transcriptional regulator n=1 Tax=Paenibacillus sp. TaxID=58172 RepID=UPI002811B6B2|nr:AraC family transcriptional regulator [Paenibacillus sp.]
MVATLDFLFRVDRRAEETIPFHRHRCYELVYYVAGEGLTRIGRREWAYRPGDFALVRPHTLHDERRTVAADVVCVGFALPETAAPPLPEGVFRDAGAEPLLPHLARMLAELQEQRPRFGRMLDLLASQLAVELERRLPAEAPPAAEDPFQYTRNYMNEHFSQKIDFASLSALAGYSYDRYRHLFKDRTGFSPGQYVVNKRLEHACKLLRQTGLSVSAVAMECGFSNDAQFCSVFKREQGMTPGQYRERGLEGSPAHAP